MIAVLKNSQKVVSWNLKSSWN